MHAQGVELLVLRKESYCLEHTREGGRCTSHDSMSNRENGSKARHTITREKRTPNLRCDGGTMPTEIDVSIELLVVRLQCHKIFYGRLIKFDILN